MRRTLCRLLHRGRYLRPSNASKGTLRCSVGWCHAGFIDQADAGILRLEPHDRVLSSRAQLAIERAGVPEAPWEAGAYRVVRGGRLVPDDKDVARRHVEGGEVVKVVKMRSAR